MTTETYPRPTKPTIKMEMMFVTPPLASTWLEKNGANRHRSDHRVTAMAADIVSGQFLPTHQGVAFDSADKLVDGQHRLAAIVKANRGVWLFVASNLPTASMGVLDSGRSRTLADRTAIAEGWQSSKAVIAMARLIAEMELNRMSGISDQQVLTVARRELANISWVISRKGPRYLTYAPVAAALAYAKPVISDSDAAEFAERLIKGDMLPIGSPILTLRNHIDKQSTGKGNNTRRQADFKRALVAIQRFVDHEECKILRESDQGFEWVLSRRLELGLPTE